MRKNGYSLKDFTINDLPKNRKEVFFDVYKTRLRTLFAIGLLTFL